MWSAVTLIVLVNSHDWDNSSDGFAEILRLLGIPYILKWNFGFPGVDDAVCKLCHERILMKLRALVEGRGGKWPDDEKVHFFNVELETLYSEIPLGMKKKYWLPAEFAEFYSRAKELFEKK